MVLYNKCHYQFFFVLFFKKYDDWKDGLPDLKWLQDALPESEKWSQFSKKLVEVGGLVKEAIVIGKSIHCL